jgi:putative salt-induced outer membrane protein
VHHATLTTFAIIAALATTTAHADWKGKAEAGALQSRGNAEATSANAKLDLTTESEKWKHNFFLGALYGENAAFATAERYETKWQSDYKITEKFSWFGALRYEADRFSGFAYQTTVSTGASYKFIDTPTTHLDASLGAGYKRYQPEILIKSDAGEVLDRIEGDVESDPVVTLGVNYEHSFTASTKLINKFLTEAGSNNTAVQNDLALQVSMTESLALAVGYAVRYNSDPPPLSESTDTTTTINLVYNIK